MVEIGTDIKKAEKLLISGELVAIPTETVYGLAGNAFDTEAILKIFEVKKRPHFNPLIVHTFGMEEVEKMVTTIPDAAYALAKSFWPGPLTLLLPRNEKIHDLVTAGSDLVAVRIPNHPLTLSLLRNLSFPLTAPSANPFGYISPTKAEHVADQLGGSIPYILDGGATTVGIESTIIGFDPSGQPLVYRLGGVELEAIEAIAGKAEFVIPTEKPNSPGQLKSHYAPKTPFLLGDIDDFLAQNDDYENIGALVFQEPIAQIPFCQQVILAPSGDLKEAARNLFSSMRKLDSLGLEAILAAPLPNSGLGRAINDRLMRASA